MTTEKVVLSLEKLWRVPARYDDVQDVCVKSRERRRSWNCRPCALGCIVWCGGDKQSGNSWKDQDGVETSQKPAWAYTSRTLVGTIATRYAIHDRIYSVSLFIQGSWGVGDQSRGNLCDQLVGYRNKRQRGELFLLGHVSAWGERPRRCDQVIWHRNDLRNKNIYYLKKAQSIRETLPEIHLEQAYSSRALIGE